MGFNGSMAGTILVEWRQIKAGAVDYCSPGKVICLLWPTFPALSTTSWVAGRSGNPGYQDVAAMQFIRWRQGPPLGAVPPIGGCLLGAHMLGHDLTRTHYNTRQRARTANMRTHYPLYLTPPPYCARYTRTSRRACLGLPRTSGPFWTLSSTATTTTCWPTTSPPTWKPRSAGTPPRVGRG
jgi:hypothetical protein